MLGYLRRNTDSILVQALLVLIAVVFIFFFGSGALTSARSEVAAEVNGEAIRDQELNQRWRQQIRFQQQFNPNMTEAQRLGLRQRSLDSLIEERLMLQSAADLGLVVSPLEIRRALLEDTSFQDDEGNFDAEAYKSYLGDKPRATETRIQASIEKRLLINSLEQTIRSSVQVSAPELEQAYVQANSSRDVEFIRVNTSRFREDVSLTGDELEAFVAENTTALQERYDKDFDRKYNLPKKVSARHILLKFKEDDGPSEKDALRTQMEGILAEARADGADFAALATEHSEDSSASRGGDLGFFDAKRMVKPFSDAAFSMEPGEISEVVETRYGFHVIKVEAIEEPTVQTLPEVQGDIAVELAREERSPELARAFAATLVEVLDGTLDTDAADAVLAARDLKIQETGSFDRGSRTIPKLGRAPEAINAAFALDTIGAVTPAPIEIPTGYVVMRLKAREEADMSTFETESEDLRDRLLRTKQTQAVRAFRDRLKESATITIAPGA